jgi:DNA-binding transcriptional LysR family regulator
MTIFLSHLDKFLAEHPNLNIDVVLDDRSIDMLEQGIDVALRMGTLSDSGMTARKIAQSDRVVLGTPAYFAKAGEPCIPADLTHHEAIVYAQGNGGATWAFRHGSTEVSVAVSGRIRVNAAEGVRAAVLADMGVAISSEWMFGPELENGSVKRVLEEWKLPPIDLWAVYPTGRMASAKARAFVAFVEGVLHGDQTTRNGRPRY